MPEQRHCRDIVILLALLALAAAYATLTAGVPIGKPLVGVAAFTLPPSVYLGLRGRKGWSAVAAATLLFGGPYALGFDFVATLNRSWAAGPLVVPGRLLGVEPVDDLLAYLAMTLLTILVYQHFGAGGGPPVRFARVAVALGLGVIGVIGVLTVFETHRDWLRWRYPYLVIGTLALAPTALVALTRPGFVRRMTLPALVCSTIFLALEVVALRQRYWTYPSRDSVGWVGIGPLRCPVEEVVFWVLGYAPSLAAYYELVVGSDAPSRVDTGVDRRAGSSASAAIEPGRKLPTP